MLLAELPIWVVLVYLMRRFDQVETKGSPIGTSASYPIVISASPALHLLKTQSPASYPTVISASPALHLLITQFKQPRTTEHTKLKSWIR